MDEEEKKQKRRDLGSTLASVANTIKALKNPIILKIAIIIVGLILLIGVVGFLFVLPGNVAGKIGDSLFGWVKNIFSESRFEVSQEDLIEMCNYLEEMGYDIEGYGFVEEITRSGDKTYKDQSFDTPEEPTRGEIIGVKSKYLESYIISERKAYAIANDDFELHDLWNTFDTTYNDFYAEQAIEDIWNESSQDAQGYVQNMIDGFYSYDAPNNQYVKKEGKEPKDTNLTDYNYYSIIPANEIRDRVKETIQAYYKYKKTYYINWDTNIEWSLNGEEKTKFIFGKNLLNELDTESRTAFLTLADNKFISYEREFETYANAGTGMIYLDNNDAEVENGSKTGWKKGNYTYDVEIDEDNRYLIVNTVDNSEGFWSIVKKQSNYAYDLNGWTCKYGKPVEALLAMHIGTGAPDFVYQFATSPAVDTKVHIDLFPVNMHMKFTTESDGEGEYIRPVVEEAIDGATKGIVDSDLYNSLISELREKSEEINTADNIFELISGENKLSNYANELNGYKDIENLASDGNTKLEELVNKLNSIRNKINPNSPAGMVLARARNLIDNIIEDIENIDITVLGESFNYEETKQLYDVVIEYEDSILSTATPYITKVENHWYRNQYFLGSGEINISQKKTDLSKMLSDINEVFSEENLSTVEIIYTYEDKIEGQRKKIEGITTQEEIDSFIEEQRNIWEAVATTDKQRELLSNIFAVAQGNYEGIIGENSSYDVVANPEPTYYQLPEEANISDSEKISNFFKEKLYVEETRSADIVQIHNPIFEDNSQYIRNWLKDKYLIFDGRTDDEVAQKTGEDTTNVFSSKKQSEGKKYIQGKTALQVIDNLLEQCTDRQNIMYLRRDLRELFEDFEFDIENVEVPAQKVLSNVMPDYIPYTPWPSEYETAQSNCTKMIYKGGNANLVAPASGTITKAENGTIEIEFGSNDEQTGSIAGMILNIKGNITPAVSVNTKVNRGDIIATASTIDDGTTTIELRLFSITKQLLRVENYMNVEHKTYDGDNALTDQEKLMLYTLQDKELIGNNGQEAFAQNLAIINVVFNRILSPLYPNLNSISTVLNEPGNDFLRYTGPEGNLATYERNSIAKSAIINALSGVDLTKTDTLIGATRYFGLSDDYYEGNLESQKEERIEELDKLKVKTEIVDCAFGITEDDYIIYLGDILLKKIDEVIYTLNYDKYIEGYEEYDDFLDEFTEAKNNVLNYYLSGDYLEGSNREIYTAEDAISSIVKSNVEQEIEETDGTITVTDKFTITANSNYMTNFKFIYTKGSEGKINSEVRVEKEVIKNY